MILPTVTLELFIGSPAAWVNVMSDVAEHIICSYGIDGDTANDRIASAGRLAFSMNNSELNSAKTLGYYSPLNASKRTGFDFNLPVRFKISYGGDTSYKFLGKLSDIEPIPGKHGPRLVHCAALDWFNDAAQIVCPDLGAQEDIRSDALVSLILDALDADDQPAARSIETGLEVFALALDGSASGSRPTVREVLNQICMSEFGYCYPKGDSTQGGTFVFESRVHRQANPSVTFTLTDALLDAGGTFDLPSSRDDVYSRFHVTVHPVSIDPSPTTVLYSLQTTEILMAPSETNDSLFGPFRDPTTNEQIGGIDTVDPEAVTDYQMNSLPNGSGTDHTADFTVTATRTGGGVRWTITNNGNEPAYITRLQLRGKEIRRYETVYEKTVANAYGNRVLDVDLPFQNNANFAGDVANHLSDIEAVPYAHIKSVRFNANLDASRMQAAILREPGDRVRVTETVTGIDALFTINRVELEYQLGGILWCTWGLEPALAVSYWQLGVSSHDALGSETILAF